MKNEIQMKINVISDLFDFSRIECLKTSCIHNRNNNCMLKEIIIGSNAGCAKYIDNSKV